MNKDNKKLPVTPPDDTSKKLIPMVQHDVKMLIEKHNDEKLALSVLIMGAGLIAYHLKKMASLLFTVGGAVVNALAFSGTNFVFSRLTDHGEEELKRHGLALEKLEATASQ